MTFSSEGYRVRPVIYLEVWDSEAECWRWEPNEYDPPLFERDEPEWGEPPDMEQHE